MTITLDKCFSYQVAWIIIRQAALHSPGSLTYSVGDVEKKLFSCEQNPCVFCVWKSFQLQERQ